ncbi:type II toxin-antitoxin system ParD family antitoxin [Humisphaera borealis]|uniref:Type II toxin-antitoxin system ParD family antitoxin n=1 Tax=Humisphaera borealis TaxID=2807512 RepID=A0A7M2X3I6_9BACT|nr:type II toxin-antitoxin system ParD family antitoxin [Humisphaera borealis]
MNVSLTAELERFVEQRVASGRYQTASEVVREGLRLLELQERDRDEAFRVLQSKLRSAAERSESGPVIDPDEVLKRIEASKRRRAGRTA